MAPGSRPRLTVRTRYPVKATAAAAMASRDGQWGYRCVVAQRTSWAMSPGRRCNWASSSQRRPVKPPTETRSAVRLCYSSPLCGQRDGDCAETEVDVRGQRVEVADAVAAALDEPD